MKENIETYSIRSRIPLVTFVPKEGKLPIRAYFLGIRLDDDKRITSWKAEILEGVEGSRVFQPNTRLRLAIDVYPPILTEADQSYCDSVLTESNRKA